MVFRLMMAITVIGLVCGGTVPADAGCPTEVAELRGGQLDAPIRLSLRDVELSKVLQAIGELAGVPIKATAGLDHRVEVVATDMSARKVLASLAQIQRLTFCQEGDAIVARRVERASR